MTTAPSSTRAGLGDVTPDDVRVLRSHSGTALLSMFVSTERSARFGDADRARAGRLLDEVGRRLEAERPPDDARAAVARLTGVLDELVGARCGASIALFERPGAVAALRLPVAVEDRVVVDPTFATRDLARAVALHPPHVVLVLARDRARTFVAAGGRLHERSGFVAPVIGRPDRRGHHHAVDLSHRRDDAADAFFKQVARQLDGTAPTHGLPLVLVADIAVAARFRHVWRRPVAGVVSGSYVRARPADLEPLVAPVIAASIAADRRVALEDLDRAIAGRQVRFDLGELWRAAVRGRLHALYVEDGHRVPARVSGDAVEPASDASAPGVVDDLVDDIAEHVAAYAGVVHWVPAGSLHGPRVAGVLRR